jgi:TolB-like protein
MEKSQKDDIFRNVVLLLLILICTACAGSPAASGADELDTAIRETSDYLNNNITHGNKLVILNFQSNFPALSEYIIDELTANTVNDRVFTVVDRANLSLIQQETAFQMSGEVSDETAVSIGQKLGAQTIVSGTVSKIGDLYRLRVRALDVATASIQGQFNRNIPNGKTVALLADSKPASGAATNTTANTGVQKPAVATQPANRAQPAATVQNTPAYKIGDTGPAGGLIFLDKGNNNGGWRYLEAAPASTEAKVIWLHERHTIDSVLKQRALGLGKANTLKIMEYLINRGGGFDTAARTCYDLVVNGFDDWFLPSFDELNWMYGNLHKRGLGEFKNERYSYYWSSTQESLWSAYVVDFSNGQQVAREIIYAHYVRAIRQF